MKGIVLIPPYFVVLALVVCCFYEAYAFLQPVVVTTKQQHHHHPKRTLTFESPSSLSRTTSALHASTDTQSSIPTNLDAKQLDFTMGYLNKHHTDVLTAFAETFSELGALQTKRNSYSGGSYKIVAAKIVSIDYPTKQMELEVTVNERGKKEPTIQQVPVSLDATPVTKKRRKSYCDIDPIPADIELGKVHPIDDLVRRLNRLCWIVEHPEVTGKLIQLGIQLGGVGVGELKDNMYLNQVPHNRYVRQYFYDMAAQSALDAVILCSEHKISNRMKIVSMFPEMNPSMDSYRIGTILELTRAIAIKLIEQNLRVRVCVQGSMGVGIFTGVPKQLNGVAKLLQMMDWQAGPGEANEGMIGKYLNFGAVGKEHVVNAGTILDPASGNETTVEQDDVFLIIAPQSMVGIESSIMGPLQEMVEAAGDRPVILINPDLTDKVSSQGQQSVRGRKQRIEFADSFQTIWHFQNIYVSGTSYFPILGSMTKLSPLGPWVAHQRRDLANNEGEVYVPVLAGETRPKGDVILECFES